FDKTGTLTRGQPQVVDVLPLDGVAPAAIVGLAASVEQRSTHPIAQAIVEHAAARHVAAVPAANVQTLSGRGAAGDVNGSHVLLGNHRLFEERRLCSPAIHGELERGSAPGRTPAPVARAAPPSGVIPIPERPRA